MGRIRRRTRLHAGWFRIDGRRFVPSFQVSVELGEAFDAMVEELVDYRLVRYLFGIRLKVIQAGVVLVRRGRWPAWDPSARRDAARRTTVQ